MATVLGINAVFHDPAAALVVDGEIVAAAEEERFSRRKHGKVPVPFSTWEVPEAAARFCLRQAGLTPADVDAVGYSYDPSLAMVGSDGTLTDHEWEGLRTLFVERAPRFIATALPGLDPSVIRFVPHHVSHAASAYGAAPFERSAVMVLDGRGERGSFLAGHARGAELDVLALADLPHSLGLRYEELTAHLGYRRSSDEYKVMALASYGEPRHLDRFRELMRVTGDGGFVTEAVDWHEFAPPGRGDGSLDPVHADLASTVQTRLEEVLLELATWLHDATGERALTLAGGVALNCVANSVIYERGPFEDVWVQPAAGDAGTALGAAIRVAHELGDDVAPMTSASLGPGWGDDELERWLQDAAVPYERPDDIAVAVADLLADDAVIAWFQGRSEFGPRALGHRSLMAHPGHAANTERLNDVKGREQFRPVAPMVLLERAKDLFEGGPVPSPYMLFTHRVRDGWRERLPAVVHVDGTARIQTIDRSDNPLVHRCLEAFEARTGLPVVVNTSLNTAGRPMVDDPRDALECFGSAPIDALALGPFLVRRGRLFATPGT
ncbi:MAG TPA: carbamoyltransferase C-terminal domain-containing protein [Aquihabitans sp.]|nr:carbamoyltransferase C-terminal domain-containing protein [Aquihabitans sp.]